jgi:hypothetical protein
MFFVRGLSSHGKEVFVNPDQVLYVCAAGFLGGKTALVLTYNKRLVVDQDPETVRQRFEDYLKDIVESDDNEASTAKEYAKPGYRFDLS